MRRWLSAWVPALALGAMLSSAAPCIAQDDYRALVEGAVTEFAAHNFAEARALFRRAHALDPNARTLRGLGMCAFELRDYTDSLRYLRAALDDARQPLTEEQRRQTEALLGRAEAFVGRMSPTLDGVAVAPVEGDTWRVDGAAQEREPDGTLLFSLGDHEVSLTRASGERLTARVEIEGGEAGPLPFTSSVAAIEPAVADAPVAVPVLAVSSPPTEPEREPDLVAPVILLSAGVVLAGAGATFLALGIRDHDTVTGAAPLTPWSQLAEPYERAPIFTGVGSVLLGIAVPSIAVAAILFAMPPTRERTTARLGVGPMSLSLEGSF